MESEPLLPRRSSHTAASLRTQRAALLASLETVDWRVLSWLLHYPFQRADDLAVGLARWTSRATIYRHLQHLTQRDLVVHVLPKTPGTGKRLYHLSNLGLHVLAAQLGTPARALAHDWQADEAGLLRLAPRLPTLLSLQDIVNGLVMHAADALTIQGRRPTLVRWNWQRDLSHHFRFHEQRMRLTGEGAVALCLRTPDADGRLSASWYGLVVLSTDLEDERLLQLRLERLLCWRESPERWPVYQSMLPVLVLVHSSRQREHWQRAMERAVQKWRLAPLVGAIACVPLAESHAFNPWRLSWQTLATGASCCLHDLLQPVPETALPAALRADDATASNVEHILHASSPPASPLALPARLSRMLPGKLAGHAVPPVQDGLDEREWVALLAMRVTPSQWQILSLLLAHPLLSTEELAVFLHLQLKSVRCSLSALRHLQCIVPVSTAVGQRWHLGAHSLHLVAAANRVPLRSIATIPDETPTADVAVSLSVVQRGVSWLLQHIQHTAGVYSFFALLTQAAEQQPGQALCWWETGALCERRYQVNDQWYNLRPDALAAFAAGPRHIPFWLEWDRGTMNVRDLTIKFTSYAQYLASREWVRAHAAVPMLVCVAPDMAQEQRILRVAQATLTKTPGLVLATTTAPLLAEYGPLAAIWAQHPLPLHAAVSVGGVREHIFCDGS
ncbi:MAG TPA: replication-relaxation family protein [Ktedonobacteraceae bacterium]|nr:replication-relaxation family protein [Ktedonobacteraceae bacterium]